MSKWDEDEEMEMVSVPPTTDSPAEQEHAGPAYQRDRAGSSQLNIDAPMEPPSYPASNKETKIDIPPEQYEASIISPVNEVNTGARRRDLQPNRRARNVLHQDRGAYRRPPHPKPSRDMIPIPTTSLGFVIGRGGSKIREIEHTLEVKINVGLCSGSDTQVFISGTEDAIKTAKMWMLCIIGGANRAPGNQPSVSGYQQHLNLTSPDAVQTADTQDASGINCKTLCEMYKKYKEERFAKLPRVIKEFYEEDPVVTAMSPQEVTNWRKEHHDMQVRRNSHKENLKPIPNPALTFEQIFIKFPEILADIYNQGFMRPYPIQSQAWPILLRGDDFICVAPSGTGKTLAVLLSALIHAKGQANSEAFRNAPTVLILAPDDQIGNIENDLDKFSNHGRFICLYKEADRSIIIKILMKGVDIVVATPKTFIDLAMPRYMKIINFSFVALIEADNMIDLGFEGYIRKILYNTRSEKQLVITCETWAMGVRLMALSFMIDPIQIKLGVLDASIELSAVTQQIQFVEEEQKEQFVMQFINNMNTTDKALIFCGKKVTASLIGPQLCLMGIQYRSLEGDLDPTSYENALVDVIQGRENVILATNVTPRNINIQGLTHVISVDYPGNIQEYVDRIERTDTDGTALTYITRDDWTHAKDIRLILEEAQQVIPDELDEMVHRIEAMTIIGRGNPRTRGRRGREWRGPGARRRPE